MPEDQLPLSEGVDWLYSTQMFGIKLGLENITRLLRESNCFPTSRTKVVQVVGTNGKGSTSAFLASLAQSHGLRTALFTSPHLTQFNERMRINGVDISDDELSEHLQYFKNLVADWDPHPTFFELSLAIAMRHFLRHRSELIILEAGMGGRLDATTAVPKDLSLITPIGLDHQQYLGETLTEIAGEKGATMRKDTPCFSAPQEQEALLELRKIASEVRCPIDFIEEPFTGIRLGLEGEHQAWNAALALEGLTSILGTGSLRYDSVKAGLQNVRWPGRFQVIAQGDQSIILDCAHNTPAAEALVKQWRARFGDQKAHLIFGAAQDKNIQGVLELVLPLCKSVAVYKLQNPRGETTQNLKTLVTTIAPDLPCQELDTLPTDEATGLTLVLGSVFLVGEWLAASSQNH